MVTKDQIKLLTDQELAIALCSSTEEVDLFNEFVKRFRKDLNEYCQKKCKAFKLEEHIGTQICHDSLDRFRTYKSFDLNEVNKSNGRDSVLVFLYKIATNRFLTLSKKENRYNEVSNLRTYLDDVFEKIDPPDQPEDMLWKRDVTLRILKKLNAKEQKVIIADLDYKKHTKWKIR